MTVNARFLPRNVNRRDKRHSETIQENRELKQQLLISKAQLDTEQHLRVQGDGAVAALTERLQQAVEKVTSVLIEHDDLLIQLCEAEDLTLEQNTLAVTDGKGHYTTAIKQLCMELATKGKVPHRSLGYVIKQCALALTGKAVDQEPSADMGRRAVIAAGVVANALVYKHMRSAQDGDIDMNQTTMHDGTSLRGRDFQAGAQVAHGRPLALRIQETSGKSAKRGFEAIDKRMMGAVESQGAALFGDADEQDNPLTSWFEFTINLLSDQGSNALALANIFEALKRDYLAALYDQFLTRAEIDRLAKPNVLACGQHFISGTTEKLEAGIKELLKNPQSDPFRLVFQVAKNFHLLSAYGLASAFDFAVHCLLEQIHNGLAKLKKIHGARHATGLANHGHILIAADVLVHYLNTDAPTSNGEINKLNRYERSM